MNKYSSFNSTNVLAQKIIQLQQQYIEQMGFIPHLHFELEGCFQSSASFNNVVNLAEINKIILKLGIEGELVAEYWKNQWEFVSAFDGQSPLKEAHNLNQLITYLPRIITQQYPQVKTLIQPVVWCGDQGKLAQHSDTIFSTDTRMVHIPNAIQLNVSVNELIVTETGSIKEGKNLMACGLLGEYLQCCFLKTSLACCLLYLPEEEAYERLLLKTKYGLAKELCSPVDISGGHQGSIALYREQGKHNQKMGEEALLYDQNNQVLSRNFHWQKTARIEHRLGASSLNYNAFFNVIFALANLIDALEQYKNEVSISRIEKSQKLPNSLFSTTNSMGAIDLFCQDNWFAEHINTLPKKINNFSNMSVFYYSKSNKNEVSSLSLLHDKLGTHLKALIVAPYRSTLIVKK